MQKLLKYKSWLLIIIFGSLFFLNSALGCIIGSLTIMIILIFETKIRKTLLNFGFLIFICIIMAVPLLWNFSIENILNNLLILLRGIILISILFIAGKDVSSTKFYNNLQKRLPEELINIIKISFTILPIIKNNIEKEFKDYKILKLSPQKSILNLFEIMVNIAEDLTQQLENNNRHKLFIITGKKHEGKSTLALELATLAKENKFNVNGIISISHNYNEKRAGYEVLNLKTNEYKQLATINVIEDFDTVCGPFYFYKEGMKFAHTSLSTENVEENDIIFIDEVGKLELEEKGFYKQIKSLIFSEKQTIIILVTREEYINEVEEKFNFKASKIFKVSDNKDQSLKDTFISAISS